MAICRCITREISLILQLLFSYKLDSKTESTYKVFNFCTLSHTVLENSVKADCVGESKSNNRSINSCAWDKKNSLHCRYVSGDLLDVRSNEKYVTTAKNTELSKSTLSPNHRAPIRNKYHPCE